MKKTQLQEIYETPRMDVLIVENEGVLANSVMTTEAYEDEEW